MVLIAALLASCSQANPASNPGAGGGPAAGGAPATGGQTASGGATPTGTGGIQGTGGGSSGGIGTATGGNAGGAPGMNGGSGFYHMERLARGVVAVQATGGVYVGWRMFGFEYNATNPDNVSYNVYRNGAKIANVTNSTNYTDVAGTATSTYIVRPVIGGVEGSASETASVWAQQYLRVPLQVPPGGTTDANCPTPNEAYAYSANDGSPGDADGDGVYEIFLKWDPSNSHDNSQSGCTGNVYLDAYKVDGTRLWRIDLGPNIRAGAHYTQFVVYDFDGDGKAEMAVKTAPGTKDGTGAYLHMGPAANDDDSAVYHNSDGYVLSGPEYLTVFNGATGAEMATVAFDQARGTVSAWGDTYGNRVDRFLSTAAYLDSTGLASFIMARGYYTRTTLGAWNWRDGKLTQLWKFDSNVTPKDAAGHPYSGQGSHSMTIANVDDDPQQEIMYGAMAIDNTGVGALLDRVQPRRRRARRRPDSVAPGPGVLHVQRGRQPPRVSHPRRQDLRDASAGARRRRRHRPLRGRGHRRQQPGRRDVVLEHRGALLGDHQRQPGRASRARTNFVVYWDGDETRELLDSNHIDKYAGGATTRLLTASGVSSNNGTKSTPTLTADLYGDWREEVVWRESDSKALRIYTTTAPTTRRIYTLMHDPQYRMQVVGEQTAYNQPPHVGLPDRQRHARAAGAEHPGPLTAAGFLIAGHLRRSLSLAAALGVALVGCRPGARARPVRDHH